MKLENTKSIILTLLILISLALTATSWNYQPNVDYARDEDSVIEAQLDGQELTKKDVLLPSQVIYHVNGEPQGFLDKSNEQIVYEEIESLSLYDFHTVSIPVEELKAEENQIEIIFPTELPTEVISDLFTIDSEVIIQNSSFDRIYIVLSSDQEENQVVFLKTSTQTAIRAHIQNFNQVVKRLSSYPENNEMISYEVFADNDDMSIYLPSELELNTQYFSYKELDIEPFHNILFNTPSTVRSSQIVGGAIYTDGIREMNLQYGYGINFTNPLIDRETLEESISQYQLIDQVHNWMNQHNGFTFSEPFQFFISGLSTTANTNLIEYNLAYKGYPIYESKSLATISVNWHNQSPSLYSHPIIQLLDERGLGKVPPTFLEATTVIDILNSVTYSNKSIYDVKVGYKVEKDQDDQIYEIVPTWYVKGFSGWSELEIPDQMMGGNNSAMGSD